MRKIIKYLENISVLLVLAIMVMLFIIFVYHVKHENLDTTYMWNVKFTNLFSSLYPVYVSFSVFIVLEIIVD